MIGWIAFTLTCLGVFLTAKKIVWCWLFLIAANFFWAYHLRNDLAALTMQLFLFGFNIYGWIQWTNSTNSGKQT
jgi:nicotinamide riboside transporter PnuC